MSDQLDAKLKTIAGSQNSFSMGQLYELMEQQEKRAAELERALAQIAAEVSKMETGQQFEALGLRAIKAICDNHVKR